jgi:penicillin-binding protein 1C
MSIAIIHGLKDIKVISKKPSHLLLDRRHNFIASVENNDSEFGYWPMPGTLPDALRITTLAAEDRRFEIHFGVDFHSIGRAIIGNYFKRQNISGASTIAMQVARLQRGGGSGWYNKIHDAVTATGLTIFYSREQILHQYFCIAPYGNRIAGAACASRRYFHKPVQDLSFAEAALLASVPKAPSRMNLFNEDGFKLAKRRSQLIINRAFKYGWISYVLRNEALAELSSLVHPKKQLRNESIFHFIRAFESKVDHKSKDIGEIRTTLDMNLQDTLYNILGSEIPNLIEAEANNAAAIIIDVKSCEVLAYVGSIDYYDPNGGAIDCASISRSTGSLLKPFIYAIGMEWQGFTPSTILTDIGHDFGTGLTSFIPENYDRKFMGPVLYKCALANSRNIPAVQVLKSVGVDMFYQKCIALGLTNDDGKANHYGLGLSIGGLYSSLQQISAAYLTLAKGGQQHELVWEMDREDTVAQIPRQIIQPDIAMQIRRFLSDPVARLPSFPRGGNLEYPFAVAVKTGTSEGFRDSWCFGWSDNYLIGVWIGNTDFTSTKNLSGYQGAARVVKKTFFSLHSEKVDGLNDVQFPPPPGYVPIEICRLTGKKADRFTPYKTTEFFKPGTEPIEYSTVQQLLPIDKKNDHLAHDGCKSELEYRRFIVLDPEFHDWAKLQGLEIPPDRYSPSCGGSATVDNYQIAITSPRVNSRFFIDPEMPVGESNLKFTCKVFPPPASVLWLINGEEYKVENHPFSLTWPMKEGAYDFQAVVPNTEFKSKTVRIEVF